MWKRLMRRLRVRRLPTKGLASTMIPPSKQSARNSLAS